MTTSKFWMKLSIRRYLELRKFAPSFSFLLIVMADLEQSSQVAIGDVHAGTLKGITIDRCFEFPISAFHPHSCANEALHVHASLIVLASRQFLVLMPLLYLHLRRACARLISPANWILSLTALKRENVSLTGIARRIQHLESLDVVQPIIPESNRRLPTPLGHLRGSNEADWLPVVDVFQEKLRLL